MKLMQRTLELHDRDRFEITLFDHSPCRHSARKISIIRDGVPWSISATSPIRQRQGQFAPVGSTSWSISKDIPG